MAVITHLICVWSCQGTNWMNTIFFSFLFLIRSSLCSSKCWRFQCTVPNHSALPGISSHSLILITTCALLNGSLSLVSSNQYSWVNVSSQISLTHLKAVRHLPSRSLFMLLPLSHHLATQSRFFIRPYLLYFSPLAISSLNSWIRSTSFASNTVSPPPYGVKSKLQCLAFPSTALSWVKLGSHVLGNSGVPRSAMPESVCRRVV